MVPLPSILTCLGALLHCTVALRLPTRGGPNELAGLPWESRPAAATASQACLLTPTYQPHFPKAKALLSGIRLHALDTVPLFLIVSSEAEAASWADFVLDDRGRLAPHTVLSLEGVASGAERNFSAVREKIARAGTDGCSLGSGQNRVISHVKKLYGMRHLGLARGCDVVWVMDCDSLPMRAFSFAEAFGRLGTVWVHDLGLANAAEGRGDLIGGLVANTWIDSACIRNAERIHKLPLDWRVRGMAVRQNDFWLYESRLVRDLMDFAVDGMPEGSSFLDAYVAGGLVSEQIVWQTWLLQRIVSNSLPDYTIAKYSIVTIAGNSVALARCVNKSSTWVPTSNGLFDEVALNPQLSYAEFGKFWYGVLGQAGIWGDRLSELCPDPNRFQNFVASVPWCVSNCHRAKVLQLLGALGAGGHDAGRKEAMLAPRGAADAPEEHLADTCVADVGFQELAYGPLHPTRACQVRHVYDVSIPLGGPGGTRRLLQRLGYTMHHTLKPAFQEVSLCRNSSASCRFYSKLADASEFVAFEAVPTFGLACSLAARDPAARFVLARWPFDVYFKNVRSALCRWTRRHCGDLDDHQRTQELLYGPAYSDFCRHARSLPPGALCYHEGQSPLVLGEWTRLGLREQWRLVHDEHEAEVRACVPAERLLLVAHRREGGPEGLAGSLRAFLGCDGSAPSSDAVQPEQHD